MRMKLWLRLLGTIVLVAVGGGAALVVYMTILQSDMTLVDLVAVFPLHVLLMGAMGMFIFSSTVQNTYIPLTVSFGCTRREAWCGAQLLLVMSAVSVLAIASVLDVAIGERLFVGTFLPAAAGALFIAGSFGGLFGAMMVRYRKLGVLLVAGMAAFFGIIAGGIAVVKFDGIDLNAAVLNLCVVVAAALLVIVNALVQRVLLRRFEVRF